MENNEFDDFLNYFFFVVVGSAIQYCEVTTARQNWSDFQFRALCVAEMLPQDR